LLQFYSDGGDLIETGSSPLANGSVGFRHIFYACLAQPGYWSNFAKASATAGAIAWSLISHVHRGQFSENFIIVEARRANTNVRSGIDLLSIPIFSLPWINS